MSALMMIIALDTPYQSYSTMGSTLHWISEKILWAVGLVPAVFVTEDSPNFKLIRGIFALLLIVFVVYIIALRPIRSVIRRCKNKTANIVTRKR